jgi:uncharacterized membrane protein
MTSRSSSPVRSPLRTVGRIALGATLVFAGLTHLTIARKDFRAQVPEWVPIETDDVVLMSGVAEIGLGGALLLLSGEKRKLGWIAATFFTAIFPGNVSQLINHRDAFGLDTDRKRAIRLIGQPLLVAWALWSTHALQRRH